MKPKYLSFVRWVCTPCSSSGKVIGLPGIVNNVFSFDITHQLDGRLLCVDIELRISVLQLTLLRGCAQQLWTTQGQEQGSSMSKWQRYFEYWLYMVISRSLNTVYYWFKYYHKHRMFSYSKYTIQQSKNVYILIIYAGPLRNILWFSYVCFTTSTHIFDVAFCCTSTDQVRR